MEVSDQPIEAREDTKMEVKASGQPIDEGEANLKMETMVDDQPIEKVPVPSLDSADIPSKVELILEPEEIHLRGDSASIEALTCMVRHA